MKKEIKGYENYEIDELGVVTNSCTGVAITTHIDHAGYDRVRLFKNNKPKYVYLHKLLADIFIDKIDGCNIVAHVDGNKRNNNLNNLKWVNASESKRISNANVVSKVRPILQLSFDGIELNRFTSMKSAADFLGKSSITRISACCKGNAKSAYGYKWVYAED